MNKYREMELEKGLREDWQKVYISINCRKSVY